MNAENKRLLSLLQELQAIEPILLGTSNEKTKKDIEAFLQNLYKKYLTIIKEEDKKVILVDMDEVLADFIDAWLTLYNQDYDDNLTIEDLKSWKTSLYVKPACGEKIYDYFKKPGLFRHLKVRPYAQEFIQNLLDNNYTVLIVSDSPEGNSYCDYTEDTTRIGNPADDKRKWLAEHFPMIPSSHIIFTSQKWYVQGDVLVDDKPATYQEFEKRGRLSILVDQPYNKDIVTKRRAKDLKEAEQLIYQLTGAKELVS